MDQPETSERTNLERDSANLDQEDGRLGIRVMHQIMSSKVWKFQPQKSLSKSLERRKWTYSSKWNWLGELSETYRICQRSAKSSTPPSRKRRKISLKNSRILLLSSTFMTSQVRRTISRRLHRLARWENWDTWKRKIRKSRQN